MTKRLMCAQRGAGRRGRLSLGGVAGLAAVLFSGSLADLAQAKKFGQVRSEVLSLHLSPAPLFPKRLPAAHRHSPVALHRWRGVDFDIDFGAPDGRDCHTLPNPNAWCVGFRRFTGHSVLKAWLHNPSTHNPRRIHVGKRTVWFFSSENDAGGWWMAWDEHDRTYGAWAWTNKRTALRRLKPFVKSLHVLRR
jgi:hypothetical protein